MWSNISNMKLAFHNPPKHYDFQDRNKLVVTWETVKLQVGLGLFIPLRSLRQMGNSKYVNR